MGERIGLSDAEWEIVGALLPAERGRGCRPAQDNRRYFEGMMWIARTGAQWRRLPDEYGKWNSVFRRYRRWTTTGVSDAMLETLAEVVERDASADMIDSTVVRAHHCAVGIKKELGTPRHSAGRAAGSRRSSTPDATRRDARSPFVLTPGQVHDVQGFPVDAYGRRPDRHLLADKGYDADTIREGLADAGVEAVIPAKANRRNPAPHDRAKYRWRNRIERLFNKLKNWRRVATRYDKTADSYIGFVSLASALLWLPFVHAT